MDTGGYLPTFQVPQILQASSFNVYCGRGSVEGSAQTRISSRVARPLIRSVFPKITPPPLHIGHNKSSPSPAPRAHLAHLVGWLGLRAEG